MRKAFKEPLGTQRNEPIVQTDEAQARGEVLVDLYAVSAKECGDRLGDGCKHPWRGGEAEWQSCELEEPSIVEEKEFSARMGVGRRTEECS